MNESFNKIIFIFIAGEVFAAISILHSATTIGNLTRTAPFIPNKSERTLIAEAQQANVFILDLLKQQRHFS